MEHKTFHESARELPVLEADVLVAGAGTAGCIAAIAAARAGANVILIEKLPVPSGTLTNGGNGIYSYFAQSNDPDKAVQIVGGIPYELFERVDAAEGSTGLIAVANEPRRCPKKPIFNHEVIKGVLCEMLLEAGVHVFLQTMLCDVKIENGSIKAAIIENKDGRSAIVARQYIDCTGDGDLAKFAGLQQVSNWQDYNKVSGAATSLPFAMDGIDFEKAVREGTGFFVKREQVQVEGHDAHTTYMLVLRDPPERCRELTELNLRHFIGISANHPHEASNINNSKGVHCDASTAEGLTRAEMENRIKNLKFANALRHCVPGFENAYMTWQAVQVGVRASKVTLCDKMLTQEEISSAARFDDEIGLYGFHDLAPTRPHCFSQEPGFYGFPYRMLLPLGCDNLFMAGRCVTLDVEAHMSTRNTVGCMIMGQGAGTAAALCAKVDCKNRELPYAELREELLRQKAILNVEE